MKKLFQIERKVGPESDGMLLREFLQKEVRLSRRALSAIKYKGGQLLVNGQERTVRCTLRAGETLAIVFPPELPSHFLQAQMRPLDIVYEDETFIVVNKPAGVPTIPSTLYPAGTLANYALAYFQSEELASTVHVVNRLDRNTSGLVLIAKNRFSHERFFNMQKRREIHRRYLAFAGGALPCAEGTIDEPIGRRGGSVIERCIDWQQGRRSITHFRTLRCFDGRTLVLVQLETGRTHQIRVHFASLGHPLIGDDLYGGDMKQLARQGLHAFELSFVHPFTGCPLRLSAPCPYDMVGLGADVDLTLL